MATTTRLTLAQVTRQVAEEYAAEGKLTVPPDKDETDEHGFWDEVQRRFDEQAAS